MRLQVRPSSSLFAHTSPPHTQGITMGSMFRRSTLRLSILLAVAGLVFLSAGLRAQDNSRWTRKYKTPPPSSHIEVTVLKADNGKPIENAAVIFHPIEGDRDKGALELKSNEDGKVVIDVIPVGDTVRLQVIANGFQTYGQDYKVDKDTLTMEIRMKRPGQQYSIYKNNGATADNSKGSGSDKNDGSSKQAAPPASNDKPSGTAGAQPDSQSGSKPDSQSSKQPDQSQDEAQSK
jgi:hypothetical protein